MPVVVQRADGRRRSEAIHLRHLHVHEHGIRQRRGGAQVVDGLPAVADRHVLAAEAPQHLGADDPVDLVVLGEQYPGVQAFARAGDEADGLDGRVYADPAGDEQGFMQIVDHHRRGEDRGHDEAGAGKRRHAVTEGNEADDRRRAALLVLQPRIQRRGGVRVDRRIHDYHVDPATEGHVALDRRVGLADIDGHRAARTPGDNLAGNGVRLVGQGVDDEHVQSGHVCRQLHRLLGRIGGQRQLDLEMECGAAARIAFRADGAAHEFDEALADREAEASAAEATRRRVVGLRERIEDRLQCPRRNADAGVLHLEAQRDPRLGRAQWPDADTDVAVGRELDGIAQQVEQDLAEPVGVAYHALGQRGLHAVG